MAWTIAFLLALTLPFLAWGLWSLWQWMAWQYGRWQGRRDYQRRMNAWRERQRLAMLERLRPRLEFSRQLRTNGRRR